MTIKMIGTLATRRRIAIVVAAGSLATTGMAVSSPAAQAAKSECPEHNPDHPDSLCVWVGAGYTGRMQVMIGSSANLDGHPSINMDKKISAVWNRTKKNVCLYGKRNFEGWAFVVRPGDASGDLGSFNNWTRSIRVGCRA